MLRLILWIWRAVIVGRQLKLCVRGAVSHFFPITFASSICGSGLCVECYEAHCKCLDPIVKQTRELHS